MTDTEHPTPDRDPDPAAAIEPELTATEPSGAAPDAEAPDAEALDAEVPEPQAVNETPASEVAPARGRQVAFAVLRGVVVLVVAAVGYQLLIPQTRIDRSRLKDLVVTRPGIKAFDIKPAGAAEQQAARIGLPAVVTASKRDANHTGIYSIEWTPTQSTGAGVVAILLPTRAEAATTLAQFSKQQLGAASYKADSLTRTATFTVGGVPASAGSVYATPASAGPATELGVAAFSSGRVVSIVQVLNPSNTQPDATAVIRAEYGHLRTVEPSFTLKRVTHPMVATILWIVGGVLVLLLAVGGPWAWRAIGAWRRRREQERLDHLVQIGGQVITKRRR